MGTLRGRELGNTRIHEFKQPTGRRAMILKFLACELQGHLKSSFRGGSTKNGPVLYAKVIGPYHVNRPAAKDDHKHKPEEKGLMG